MFRRFLYLGGRAARSPADGTRPLHPAAEAGEENDDEQEKESYETGRSLVSATNAVPYDPRPQNPNGDVAGGGGRAGASGDADRELADTACRAEQREH